MNIVFIATTGVFQALIAANLHMDRLNDDYRKLPFFSNYTLEQRGRPIYLGEDLEGNRIYVLGVGPDIGMVKKCLEQFREILDTSEEELHLIPISIKSQQIILLLHKIFKSGVTRTLSILLIIRLLKKELPIIAAQLQQEKLRKN